MYTIVDIETTGNGIKGNRITEIAIFKFDGDNIIEEFTSLVNPECEIPHFITGLTGIDNHLVRNAPTLSEIAPKIQSITENCVFVAHSVNFDYNVIKNEFKNLGLDFTRKKLCTVRLSRKVFPGFRSYSLGKLCSSLSIPLTDRHRARGDAHATVLLFQKILRSENSAYLIKAFLNARSQEATLPPSLSREIYERLPTKPGVYYFKDERGTIIYVGKAKNIKKRVLGHFYDTSDKEVKLCRETKHIDYELTGNELVALLLESAQIKHHFPKFNRAQKYHTKQYGIFTYEDRKGILHLAYNRLSAVPDPLFVCYNLSDCRLFIEQLCEAFQLCPKYCHLQENVRNCSHFRISTCSGICRETEAVQDYNERVRASISYLKNRKEDFIIKEKGRFIDEDALVLVENGLYCGFGFIPKEASLNSIDDLRGFIQLQKNTLETQRLVYSYLVKHPDTVLNLNAVRF